MNNKSLLTALIISLLIFISVTYIFTAQNGFMYDQSIANWAEDVSSPFILNMMELVSLFGASEIILLFTVVITGIFLLKKDWYHIILFLSITVGGVFLNIILKVTFQRERPEEEVSHMEVFGYPLDIPSYSFPSGHTMKATIMLLFLMYLVVRFLASKTVKTTLATIGCLILAGVALSRVLLGYHFLSDTIAAMSISVVWVCLCLLILKRFDRRINPIYRPVIGKH